MLEDMLAMKRPNPRHSTGQEHLHHIDDAKGQCKKRWSQVSSLLSHKTHQPASGLRR
ncbi:hypothetical protein TorRG33x02_261800 [Trema orientale]|uniref:Uncharacterized protein n=1 Tax=Trema orientale TaxID=63057 RepID=A0A2P5D5K0_TREOI|nr:hypothetical protein TorRG33x02_261800 [Trema orientale]